MNNESRITVSKTPRSARVKDWCRCGLLPLSAALLLSGCKDTTSDAESQGQTIGGEDLSPACIAVEKGVVYFTENGGSVSTKGVYKTAVGGNSSTLLATATLDPSFLVTDGKYVWWIERTGKTASALRRVSVNGGSAEVVDDQLLEISALAIDQTHVYYNDKTSGALYKVPLEGGDPVLLYTANTTVVVALAADGQHLYFTLAFDAPNGQILRIPISGSEGPTTVVSNLGTPFALAVDEQEICWRELQGGTIGCAPKEGGGTAKILAAQQSFLPLEGYILAMDQTSLFYPSGKDLRRVARAASAAPHIVARAGQFAFSISAVAIDDTNVYWSDSSSLRQIDKTHVLTTTKDGGVPGGDGLPTCSSDYNGEYFGKFLYEYDAGDPQNPPLTPVAGSLTLNLTFKCLATAAGSTILTITHAMADDPYFGCQLGGCTPLFGSVATLPAAPPTTPSNPSQSGQGIMVLFPNGTTLGTTNTPGALNVTGGGRILSNSLDPAFQDNTWVASSMNSGTSFPTQRQQGTPVTRWKSWQLDHSALGGN